MSIHPPVSDTLKGRVVLITGAYGGLGRELSLSCASEGATVILLGRSMPHLEKLYDEIEEAGGAQPGIIPLDLEGATQKDYDDIAGTIEKEFGQLNALVHCAAQLGSLTPISLYAMADWQKVMLTNMTGPLALTQSLIPLLERSPMASLLFTLDDHNTAYWGAYGVSKAAIRSTARILADEMENLLDENGHPRIAVNLINPGPMRTRLRAKAFPGEQPTETPTAASKVSEFLRLIARTDPKLTGADIRL